ncbi:hypothetical protein [Methylobacter sp.]|uniref:hypothetical protein n=1 Tax=Methylobacter sp. TaxID=2051955 RepID=UPI0025D13437|nr:hypothetical protein [Methylobacter sp.]
MLKDEFDTSKNRKGILSADEPVTDSDDGQQRDSLVTDTAFDDSDSSDLQDSESMTDLLDEQPKLKKNIRVATRFIREDIAASINIPGLLSFSKTIPVNLMDIASKGVLVSTDQRLGINKKIILTLQFKSGKVFEIKGIIVRRSSLSQKEYGIKFDHYNNELGDYLLETQGKLIFK